MGAIKNRVMGLMMLGFQIGMLFAYGFGGQFSTLTINLDQSIFLHFYWFVGLLAIGAALMLSFYSRGGNALGLGTAIVAIAISLQLGPLFQKFWFNAFVDEFGRSTPSGSPDKFIQLNEQLNVPMSVSYLKNAMIMTVSYLFASLATIGRTGMFEVFTSVIIYNIIWPIPLFVNIRLYYTSYADGTLIFDDFGNTYVYTFAAWFGVIYSIFLNCKVKENSLKNAYTSSKSMVMAIFGATIVFCTLPYTIFVFFQLAALTNTGQPVYVRYGNGIFNMYMGMATSTIICIIFSILFGSKKFGITNVMMGILSGAAICSEFAAGESNLGPCIAVGAFGGLITALWMSVIHPRINNKSSVKDAIGLIGGVLIPSFIGGVIVAPTIYRIYFVNDYPRLSGGYRSYENIRFSFIFYFITMGAGIFAGAIAGISSIVTMSKKNHFTARQMYSPDYGLCNKPVNILEGVDEGSNDKKKDDYSVGSGDNLQFK